MKLSRGERFKSPLFFIPCLYLFILVSAIPIWAQDDNHHPLTGMWKTRHPNIEWGEVYISFIPEPGSMQSFVSIWNEDRGSFYKLQDSLKDHYTKAELVFLEGQQYIAWLAEDGKSPFYNPVKEYSEKKRIILLSDQDDQIEIILDYISEPEPSAGRALAEKDFAGTYSYYDPSIGYVSLVVSQTGANDFTLTIAEEIPGAGYAFVREGFYGGLVKDDWLTKAKITDDGKGILWYRPGKKTMRTSRVTTIYTDGSIGISAGDSRLETGLLKRKSENSTVVSIDDLLNIDGFYLYSEPDRNIKALVYLEKTKREGVTKYLIHRLKEDGDQGPGLFPGDPFDQFEFYHANNSWNVCFSGSSENYTEYLLLLKVDTDGSFFIGDKDRKTIASFEKDPLAILQEDRPEIKRRSPPISWEDLTKDEQNLWMMFSVWKKNLGGSWKSKNISALGFPSINAMLGPQEEFDDFFIAALNPDWYKSGLSIMDQRFPDRYRFLQECLKARQLEDILPEQKDLQDWHRWLDPKLVTGLELIITTPASSSMASIAGHLLLLIHWDGESPDYSNSLVAGFVGNTTRDDGSNIDTLSFMLRGLVGYYKSLIQVEPYSSLCMRANIKENRDVTRFDLLLDRHQIERLLERLWTQSHTSTYDYKFFSDNCAGLLLDSIALAVSDPKLTHDGLVKAPVQVLNRLISAGLAGMQVYPSSLSIVNAALEANRAINTAQNKILAILPESETKRLKQIFQTLSRQRKSTILLDPLFREPYSIPDDTLAASSFQEFSEIIISNLEEDLIESSLRFLHHAFQRELYFVMPEAAHNPERLPKFIIEAETDKLARAIMTRRENSHAIKALRLATSRIRLYAYSKGEELDPYSLPQIIKEESIIENLKRDTYRGIKHGFFPLIMDISINPHINNLDRETAFEYGFSLGTAFFSADMGDDSFCSLNPKIGMEILKTSGNVYFTYSSGETELDEASIHSLLLNFRTILPVRKLRLSENLKPAISFVLMDASYSIWDGSSFFPGFSAPSTLLGAKFGVFLAESQALSNFLGLWSGIEYGLSGLFSSPDQFLNAHIGMESRWKHKKTVFFANLGASLNILDYGYWEPEYQYSFGIEAGIGKLQSSRFSIYYDFNKGFIFRLFM